MTEIARSSFIIILLVVLLLPACSTSRGEMTESHCMKILRGGEGKGDRHDAAYRLMERRRYQDAIDYLWCCTISGEEQAEAYYHLARIIALMASDPRMKKDGLEYAYLPCNQGYESSLLLFLKIAIYFQPGLRTRLAYDDAFNGIRSSSLGRVFDIIEKGPKWKDSEEIAYPTCMRVHMSYFRTFLIYTTNYRVLEIVDSDTRSVRKKSYWESCATLKVGPDEHYYDIFNMSPTGGMYSPGTLEIERKKK